MFKLRSIPKLISSDIVLWILMLTTICFFAFVAFARQDNFHARRLDLGNMEQVVWNVLHGNGFTMTDPMGTEQISRVAVHADFLLLFMVPFYAVWQDAKILLLVQTVVVALGALPLYWIAKDILKSKLTALFFALMYLLYPALQHMLLHDFHAVALSTTFLLFAYWYMEKRRYGWFVLYAVLAGLGKETVWLSVGLMGLYIFLRQKNVKLGLGVAIAGLGIFYFLFWHWIPAVAVTGKHFALSYLSEFGNDQSGIVSGLIRRPDILIRTMLLPDRLDYYFRMLQPVAFLPLLTPFVLIFAAHSIVINILSSNGLMRLIDYQYNADIIPFIFIAAIFGFQRMEILIRLGKKYWNPRRMRLFASAAIVFFVSLSSFGWGEIPLTMEDRFYYFIWPLSEKRIMQKVANSIDSTYTVSVTNNIGSHFAKRQYLYNYPINAKTADYTVVRLGDYYAWPSGTEQRRVVEELLVSADHTLIAIEGDFYAFKRK